MPIDLITISGFLIQAAADGGLVLFIGAGISKQAQSRQSDIPADWPELINEIGPCGKPNRLLRRCN